MNRKTLRSVAIVTALTASTALTALGQGQAFDRTRPPALRPPARIKMPPVPIVSRAASAHVWLDIGSLMTSSPNVELPIDRTAPKPKLNALVFPGSRGMLCTVGSW